MMLLVWLWRGAQERRGTTKLEVVAEQVVIEPEIATMIAQ